MGIFGRLGGYALALAWGKDNIESGTQSLIRPAPGATTFVTTAAYRTSLKQAFANFGEVARQWM